MVYRHLSFPLASACVRCAGQQRTGADTTAQRRRVIAALLEPELAAHVRSLRITEHTTSCSCWTSPRRSSASLRTACVKRLSFESLMVLLPRTKHIHILRWELCPWSTRKLTGARMKALSSSRPLDSLLRQFYPTTLQLILPERGLHERLLTTRLKHLSLDTSLR